jgi:hypothetical protein
MPKEVTVAWECSQCEKKYKTEQAAVECENSHPTEGEVVSANGYRRHHGSTPREVTVVFSDGQQVEYRRVPGYEDTVTVVEDDSVPVE